MNPANPGALAGSLQSFCNRKLCLPFVVLACISTAAGAGKKSNTIYTDDVDEWHVELFAGAPNSGGMLQGPAMEAGLVSGGSMCVFPDGVHQKFFAGDGVIYRVEKEGTFRRLAGQPGLYGTQDGPIANARPETIQRKKL